MGVSPLVDVDQNHPMMETPRWRCSSHRGIKSGPWKNKTCDKAVVHHVINHRTRCQTIFSGSFVFVFLMFLQGAWQEGSANQRGWISMFELKQLWNMKYIAFRHISQRNQLEISLETSKHLETSRVGPWDHELCKSTKWFCFKGTYWMSSKVSWSWSFMVDVLIGMALFPHFRMELSLNIENTLHGPEKTSIESSDQYPPWMTTSHQFSNEKLQVDRCRRTSNELFHTVDAAEILREPVMSTTW